MSATNDDLPCVCTEQKEKAYRNSAKRMRFRESKRSKKMADLLGDFERQCEEEEILLLPLLLRRRRRRLRAAHQQTWSKQWILRRGTQGAHANLIRELNAEDPEQFRQYHRLSQESFHQIVAMVSPLISKQDMHLRMAIKSSERLSVTLHFLATGL